jgi:hypothetical protein
LEFIFASHTAPTTSSVRPDTLVLRPFTFLSPALPVIQTVYQSGIQCLSMVQHEEKTLNHTVSQQLYKNHQKSKKVLVTSDRRTGHHLVTYKALPTATNEFPKCVERSVKVAQYFVQ